MRRRDESGGAILISLPIIDFTGLGLSLTARLGAGNLATEIQLSLSNAASNFAVFSFPTSSFNSASFTKVTLPSPTVTTGPIDLTQITAAFFMGNLATTDLLAIDIDQIAVPTNGLTTGPSTLALLTLGLLPLLRRKRT